MKRLSPSFLPAIVTALGVVTAYWLFATTAGLGGSDWAIQPNTTVWPFRLWLFPLGTLAVFGGLAGWFAYHRFRLAKTRKSQVHATALALTALSLLSLVWPWALFGPSPAGKDIITTVVATTWSDVTTSFFELSYVIDNPRTFTAGYADERQKVTSRYSARVPTHPPGTTLFYYAARRTYESSPLLQNLFASLAARSLSGSQATLAARSRIIVKEASGHNISLPDSAAGCALWCAFLLSLAAMATVPAVYLLGAGREANEGRGLLSAALFALSPSVGLFTLGSDVLISLAAAWILVLVMRHLDRPAWPYMAGAGVLLGLTSFISFGALAIGVIVVLAVAMQACTSKTPHHARDRFQQGLKSICFFGGGFFLLWLLLTVVFPMQPLRIYRQAMEAHHFAAVVNRDYLNWVIMDPIVFAVFAGWSVAIPVLILGIFRSSLQMPRDTAVVIGNATLMTVALLTVSGKVRGETERLWMFLLPSICVLAAYALLTAIYPRSSPLENSIDENEARLSGNWPAAALMGLLVLQAAQSLMMAAALTPLAHN